MKKGSALLSLVIGMLIASIVFIVLINSLHQFISIDTLLNNSIDQTKRFLIASRQVEKDLMGASVIHQATGNKQKKAKQKKEKTDLPMENNNPVKNEKKEEKKPLKECFFLKGKPTGQVILSFITSNGKEPYWPKQIMNNASFLKRITYSLEQDPAYKESFRLMRHENRDFTFIAKPQKSTVLLDHIASFSLSASYRTYVKEKKAESKENSEPSPKKKGLAKKQKTVTMAFKTTDQWNDAFVYEQKDEFVSRIPDTIFITYELFDNQYKRKSHHAQTITLMSDGFYAVTDNQKMPGGKTPTPPQNEKEETAPFPKPSESKKSKQAATNSQRQQSSTKIASHHSMPSFFNNGIFGPPFQLK